MGNKCSDKDACLSGRSCVAWVLMCSKMFWRTGCICVASARNGPSNVVSNHGESCKISCIFRIQTIWRWCAGCNGATAAIGPQNYIIKIRKIDFNEICGTNVRSGFVWISFYLLPHSLHECVFALLCTFKWLIKLIFCTNFCSHIIQPYCRSFVWIFACILKLLRFFILLFQSKEKKTKSNYSSKCWKIPPFFQSKLRLTFCHNRYIGTIVAFSLVHGVYDGVP